MAKGANRGNPTAIVNPQGRRIAGQRTAAGINRLRRPIAGIAGQIAQARRNRANAERRRA